MPLVLFYTKRVREVLKAPSGLLADFIFLLFVGGVVGMLIIMGKQAAAPMTEKTVISLSYWILPKYTLMSLCRGFAAYFLSLVFTLVYATVAAHSRRAEKLMIPCLDVLQSIPVLSFLPTVVLAMIALFPTREIGLEIACVVLIFTAQAWNMTFSMFGSIKNIPTPLREAATVYRLGGWRIFRVLELPASMIGLVWNSMMSMAGGWFVLTVSEAFTLKDRDFRLPGLGSYMGEAIGQFDPNVFSTLSVADRLSIIGPIVAATVAMIIMIVAVDQLFWRPIVVWSERFKMEETAETDKPESWVLDLLQHSRIYQKLRHWWRSRADQTSSAVGASPARAPAMALATVGAGSSAAPAHGAGNGGFTASGNGEFVAGASSDRKTSADPAVPNRRSIPRDFTALKVAGGWLVVAILAVGSAWGLWALGKLIWALPAHDPSGADWVHVIGGLGASFLRTSAAVLIGGVWTLPVGIIIGLSPKWSQRLQPIIQVVASFPAPMLFPLITLFVIWIHVPFTIGCIGLMLMGTQWYILFNVIAGAMAIPGDLKEVGTVFGTGALKRWTRLYIPCVFPYLVTGLVTAAGGAWNATIISEYVVVNNHAPYAAFGIGSIISEATNAGNFPLLAAATVVLALAVVMLNRAFWKRLYRVAEERYSLNV